jgi:flagellar L-ring protein precursor FlgH
MNRAVSLLVLASALWGCGPRHVQPFTPRHRKYENGDYARLSASGRASDGSLFSDASGGFLEDTRARRVGDVVLIRITEAADAQGTSTTHLNREGDGATGVSSMLGMIPALKRAYPTMDTEKLLSFATKNAFSGEGDTARKGTLSGSIAVRISRSMPNGDLYLEGTKVVLINNEEYHLYVSGLVRQADIMPDNTVPSTRVADAQIEFTGRGDIAEQQRKGWFARLIDTVNPL